jgi:hypothetical protein
VPCGLQIVTVDSDELVLLPLCFQVCFDNFDVPVTMRALLAMHILPANAEAMIVSDKLRPHLPPSTDAARSSDSVRRRSLFSRPMAAPPASTSVARIDSESLSRFIAKLEKAEDCASLGSYRILARKGT